MGNAFLHYVVSGDGPVTVLLHGFCESLEVWEAQHIKFAQSNRVISIDLPGFGRSSNMDMDLSMEAMAYEVLRVLDRERVDKACFFWALHGRLCCPGLSGSLSGQNRRARPHTLHRLC